ncbi:MAG TPA: flagellin FliC [Gammaproteobacteria bacterium]|nr:flagellin FliC [Gammaproteobacteria bacterium]
MALTIATNVGALNAAAAAQSSSRSMEVSMERLSTGKRINSGSDDVSGLGSASRMTSEIRGSNQSIRNALDAQSLVNTADGAHKEVDNILQRMREIAIQAANDTNNGQDRDNLQVEMDAMVQEIDRIAFSTTWAGAKLMDDAGGKEFSFMVGAAPDITSNVVSVTINRMNATGLAVGDGTNSLVRVDDAVSGDGSGDGRARDGIALIDTAIDTVSSQRSRLGAVSNRLDHTINNLSNVASNVSSARGRIEDADYAMETTNLAKNQILQRASMAMLSQANVSKGSVLGLLRS